MTQLTPVQKAKLVFDSYAAMDSPDLPQGRVDMSALQVKLSRWQVKNFGPQGRWKMFMGMVEEMGEAAHALLKHDQNIRGMGDPEVFREAVGDAVIDMFIYGMQLLTCTRLDAGTLLFETAEKVMDRDWKKNPENAHEAASV